MALHRHRRAQPVHAIGIEGGQHISAAPLVRAEQLAVHVALGYPARHKIRSRRERAAHVRTVTVGAAHRQLPERAGQCLVHTNRGCTEGNQIVVLRKNLRAAGVAPAACILEAQLQAFVGGRDRQPQLGGGGVDHGQIGELALAPDQRLDTRRLQGRHDSRRCRPDGSLSSQRGHQSPCDTAPCSVTSRKRYFSCKRMASSRELPGAVRINVAPIPPTVV